MKATKIDVFYFQKLSDQEKIDLRNKARNLLEQGHKLTEITNVMCTSQCAIHEILSFKMIQRAEIGSKDEAYFTEKEMLTGYVVPSYKDLSIEEKSIFLRTC